MKSTNNRKGRVRTNRPWAAVLCALALAGAGTFGVSSAHAEPLTIGVFIGAVAKVYSTMSQALNLLKKPNDPAAAAAIGIVTEIKKSEQNILNQLQKQMFLQQQQGIVSYRTKVQTVLDRFGDMSSMLTNNTQLPVIRTQTQLMSDEVLTFFAETVSAKVDVEAAYQLAPAFNMLLGAHLGILKMAGEINVNDTMPISFYATQLRRGMDTNYLLIGAQEQACGGVQYCPLRTAYFIGRMLDGRVGNLIEPYKAKTYKASQLYTQKFSNRWYSVFSNGFQFDCNPGTRLCFGPTGAAQSCDNPQSTQWKNIFGTCLLRADNSVSQTFNADPTVQGIRQSMLGMMSLGCVTVPTMGGGFPGTDMKQGSFFDPWVVNTACGTSPVTGKPAGHEYVITP